VVLQTKNRQNHQSSLYIVLPFTLVNLQVAHMITSILVESNTAPAINYLGILRWYTPVLVCIRGERNNILDKVAQFSLLSILQCGLIYLTQI
jgi:hypothetical protein